MNTVGCFEIQSSNPSRELEFYKNGFGWNFFKEEHLPIEYYRIQTNSINGGLLKRPAQVPPPQAGTNSFCCSIQVGNFDQVQELLLKNEGQVAIPKFAVQGRCWQGYFIDADNNVFGIFEVDEKANQNETEGTSIAILAFLINDFCLGQENQFLRFTVLDGKNHRLMSLADLRVNCSDGSLIIQFPDSNGLIAFNPSRIKSDSAFLFIRILSDTILATKLYKNQIHPVGMTLYVDMDSILVRHKDAIDLPKKKNKKKRRD